MLKLRRIEKRNINESKQVGTLYHVCNADAIANYIAPNDTLSASGKFINYLKGGNTFISFTRNKRFTVNVEATHQLFLFKFVVNGDLLSENYTVMPYNDFAFDTMGRKLYVRNVPTKTEFEEIVNGPIKSFSRYVEKILFTYNIKRFLNDYDFDLSIINTLREDLHACKSYVNRNHIEYSPEFCKISDEGNRLVLNKYPISFNEVVHLMDILCSIREGSAEYIKDYLKWFNTDIFCVRDFLLGNLSYDMIQEKIPMELYENELIKDSNSWGNDKIREMIEKYPPEIDSTNKFITRGNFLALVDLLKNDGLECCLTKEEIRDNIERIPQSKIREFIQNCVYADKHSSSFHNLLFSTFFRGLLNYKKIIKDMDTTKYNSKFSSLIGYDLIRKLEKENILSKDNIEYIFFSEK